MSRYQELAVRLEEIVAELDDLALGQLREAWGDGAERRPTSEKEITRARRAVEKAAQVLRRLDDVSGT